MGYRVDYVRGKKIRRSGAGARKAVLAAAALLLVVIFSLTGFRSQGARILAELTIPGNAAVTAAALEDLAWNLHAGEDVSWALEEFCRAVIYAAEPDSG